MLHRARFDENTDFEHFPIQRRRLPAKQRCKTLAASTCFNRHAFRLDHGEYRAGLITSSSIIIAVAPISAKASSSLLDSMTPRRTTVYVRKWNALGIGEALLCIDYAYDLMAQVLLNPGD